MFLELADYDNVIRRDVLNRVIENNDSNRLIAEFNAQSLIEDYLRSRYNVMLIFSALGENRSRTIVRYMIDIVLYDVFTRIAPDQMNELRLARYEEAIRWLKDVRDGKLSPDLPKNIDETLVPIKSSFVKSNYKKEDFNF